MQQVIYTVAVLVFTVNMLAGVVMKARADSIDTPVARQQAFRNIIRSDIVITIPSLLGILAMNFYVNAGKTLVSAGLSTLIPLLIIYSTLMFIFMINPIRNILYRLATDAVNGNNFNSGQYEQYSRRWIIWGTIELLPLVGGLLYSVF